MTLPHSKFIHVGLSHQNGPLVHELLDYCSIIWWNVVCNKNCGRYHHQISVNWKTWATSAEMRTDLGASWRHRWSWHSLCRSYPWLQRVSHPEDLWGHLMEDKAKHVKHTSENRFKQTLKCAHLVAAWFQLLEPASVPAPQSQWCKHSDAEFSWYGSDTSDTALWGRSFPPSVPKTPAA